ncbi:hypothetical protein, variant [Puccinia triticina 1-1 BBBD Race 1]|uniref:CTP_transf_like domain-containing protein n=2 Tax=Puccinia triticina TaxID=208348 RepID=A0A0C4EJ75_PUCT1|nr:uncharacterized protein PtA15_2A320 [Puccinia triticina]OAV94902.1 hypothetical protein PTTG_00792 [Puccinia triticina 1-1 BBBD Race 1]OAV94903.1 hypothetical protein, variant [Puccinia triticina 1-1 BBBD Race 1]WAQ82007.1 hypothetical protein PtA15_2A320 [Puccinia triticina]WAR52883.1 hypothetical protein PtB15_2B311 [Puccinia triticina]
MDEFKGGGSTGSRVPSAVKIFYEHLTEEGGTSEDKELSADFKAAVERSMKTLKGTDTVEIELELKSKTTGRRVSVMESKKLERLLSRIYVEVERQKTVRDELLVQVEVSILGFSKLPRAHSAFNPSSRSSNHPDRHFETLALGGTFDHLHSGHKILLTIAAWLTTRRLIIGITDDELLKNKQHARRLESLEERQNTVRSFLERVGPQDLQIETPRLKDVYGPTASDPDIDALLVSQETLPGAQAIDDIRIQNGLNPLARYVIDVISDHQTFLPDNHDLKQLKISSTHIRAWIDSRQTTNSLPNN